MQLPRQLWPVLSCALCLLVAGAALYGPANAAPQQTPSFSFAPGDRFALGGGQVTFSSPTLADVTGDGTPEVLVGTTACNGAACTQNRPTVLEVWHGTGSRYWQRDVGGPINGSPSVADIDGDGDVEILISIGMVGDIDQDGGVVAYSNTGQELWRFKTIDHLDQHDGGTGDGYADGVFSTPSLCDVDLDGDLEIAFGAWDHRFYLLDHTGSSLWNNSPGVATGPGYTNGDTVWSSPACGDLNGDGFPEIVIGADMTGGGILPDGLPAQDGGFVYVLDGAGNVLVRRFLPEAIYSSPALADLDGNGSVEIVVGTSWSWWDKHGRTEQPYVYAFNTANIYSAMSHDDANKLPNLPGWPRPTEYPGFSSPAIADLDGDGDLEVIIGTSHPDLGNDAIPGAGRVHAWHHNGQNVAGWPISPKNSAGDDSPIFSSPSIGDIDADGQLEVLFAMLWDVQVYNANGSFQERLNANYTVVGSPAIGDATGDGLVEVWIGGSYIWNDATGFLWRFENGAPDVGDHPWPMFHHNAAHTGANESGARLSAPDVTYQAMTRVGSSQPDRILLPLRNTGDAPLSWDDSGLPAGVTISPGSGSLAPGAEQIIVIDVRSAGRPLGTYNLNVTFTASNGGEAVAGSPLPVPITLHVVNQINTVSTPILFRK